MVFLDLREAGETCSKHRVGMSRKGNCWDNGVAESFFSRVAPAFIIDDAVESSLAYLFHPRSEVGV